MKTMPAIAKKLLSIAIALLIGGGMVFLAAYEGRMSVDTLKGADGEQARGDALTVVSTNTGGSVLGAQYSKNIASTTTEFIAGDFIATYISAQKNKGDVPLSDAEVQGIVQAITEKVRESDKVKLYNENDLSLVSTSDTTTATYQKELTAVLTQFSQKGATNEMLLVAQALDARDKTKLVPLTENIASYQTLVNTLIAMSVPRTLTNFHLTVLQGYANMLAGIIDMKEIIADPARGMRGISKYQSGAEILGNMLASFNTR